MEPTNSQILEAVNKLGKKVDGIESSIDDLAESVAFIKDNAVTKQEFDQRFDQMDAKMITIDDLSRVSGNVRGDMVQLVRKEDDKVNTLVDSLEEEKALPPKRIEAIRSHHVFPTPPSTASSAV